MESAIKALEKTQKDSLKELKTRNNESKKESQQLFKLNRDEIKSGLEWDLEQLDAIQTENREARDEFMEK